MTKRNLYYLIACITLILAGMYIKTLGKEAKIPLSQPLDNLPETFEQYTSKNPFAPFGNIYNPTTDEYILKVYTEKGDNRQIFVFVGYWESQDENKGIRPPRYTTEGWGYYWIRTKILNAGPDGDIKLKEFLNERGSEKELVYYCYIIDKKTIPDEYRFRFFKTLNSLCNKRNNAALLRVSTPVTVSFPVKEAEILIEDFIKDFLPILKNYLPG
jgi:EpsI family protein